MQDSDRSKTRRRTTSPPEADALYRLLFGTANDAIFLMEGDRFVDCNPTTLRMFGCERHQIIGQPPYRFSPPYQPDGRPSSVAAQERIRAAVEEGPQFFEWTHTRLDGTPFIAEVSLNRLDHRGAIFLQAIVRDITRRREAEDELRRSRQRYRDLFEHASDGIVIVDVSGRILDANPRFAEMTGFAIHELVGRQVQELFVGASDEDIRNSIRRALAGDVVQRNRTILHRHGMKIEVEGRGRQLPDGSLMALYRDVTDSRRLERERERLERIESLGILAGGIAHDFNNILAAALGYVELGLSRGESIPGVARALDRAVAAIERARKLTQQLLAFSRGGEPVRRLFSLPAVIRDSADFALRGSNVGRRLAIDADLWPIEGDEGQIGQVMHNLVLNAQQAMHRGGQVTITARNVRPGELAAGIVATAPQVEISLSDEGGGIAEENLPRIFDPYFTTKSGGVGLGLPTAYRIVQKHGGHLTVSVNPGVGTTFFVVLPASPDLEPEHEMPEADLGGGHGRVLAMDDEQGIRDLLREVLGEAGYDVWCVADGAQAVEAWRHAAETGRPFDVGILDLTVPGGMGGRETAQRIRALDASARLIVSSGYSNDPVMSRFREEGFDGVCVKPYRMSALLAELGRVLGRGTASSSG